MSISPVSSFTRSVHSLRSFIHSVRSFTPFIHSLRSFTRSVHSLRSFTPFVHFVHSLRSFTPFIHSVRSLRSFTPFIHSVHSLRSLAPFTPSFTPFTPSFTPLRLVYFQHRGTTRLRFASPTLRNHRLRFAPLRLVAILHLDTGSYMIYNISTMRIKLHRNCPAGNPNSIRRVVYIRDNCQWRRIGTICLGCGKFHLESLVHEPRQPGQP